MLSDEKLVTRRGIAEYRHEQRVLLRLLRRSGGLSADEFDRIFLDRRRKLHGGKMSGDTFILGMASNVSIHNQEWGFWLELMQHMVVLDMVDVQKMNGQNFYTSSAGIDTGGDR